MHFQTRTMCEVVVLIGDKWVNTLKVYNRDTLLNAVGNRPADQPLVTFCNHHSCIDDPALASVLKWRHLLTSNELLRWTPAASDICFNKSSHARFFAHCRVVPVIRGEGVYQQCMDFLLEKLNSGAWVHIFPEGQVNMTHELMRLKWGIGRLIAECKTLPLVIPFWHQGMDDVLPNKKPYYPKTGKKVTVLVGDPIDLKDMLEKLKDMDLSPKEIHKQITDRLQEEFYHLKERTELLHYGHNMVDSEHR